MVCITHKHGCRPNAQSVSNYVSLAEERTTTNPTADDMNACKELYEMTLEIVGQKAPEILNMAMPA